MNAGELCGPPFRSPRLPPKLLHCEYRWAFINQEGVRNSESFLDDKSGLLHYLLKTLSCGMVSSNLSIESDIGTPIRTLHPVSIIDGRQNKQDHAFEDGNTNQRDKIDHPVV